MIEVLITDVLIRAAFRIEELIKDKFAVYELMTDVFKTDELMTDEFIVDERIKKELKPLISLQFLMRFSKNLLQNNLKKT
jgi:hypothetical protein